MDKAIKVSRNELLALFKRVFEQASQQQNDYSYSAEAVVWLELRGLAGVEAAVQALPILQSGRLQRTETRSDDALHAQLDASGCSLLTAASAVGDAAIAATQATSPYFATIENGEQYIAIVPELCRLSQLGRSALAWWPDIENDCVYVVQASDSNPHPVWRQIQIADADKAQEPKLRMAVATDANVLLAKINDTAVKEAVEDAHVAITVDEFAARFESCMSDGIEIDEQIYRQCCAVADKVLVESTEQSRGGAGE
ncbi:MAG: hypothetical protein ACR2QT_09370 [Woeseiaceae bacterium]